MALYEIKNLKFKYPESETFALDGIDLSVDNGEFLVLCGKSGCGKSTLLRHLKTVLTPHGKRIGEILFSGKPLAEADLRTQTSRIGFVLQNPDNQIVTDKVWHELAFGLESLGIGDAVIRLRVAEMASFFGIQGWYHKSVFELSGGQKQLLNLAAVMTMQPEVLILDEPTSQLDPIAASDFLATIKKINTEIGTTVILSEHRLEEVLREADNVVVMGDGKIIAKDAPAHIGHKLKALKDPMLYAMPTPMRTFLALEESIGESCPVTVREGRDYLARYAGAEGMATEVGYKTNGAGSCHPQRSSDPSPVAVKDVWFRYEKNGEDILRGLTLDVRCGEMFCVVGGNGTGKTTALGVLSGLFKPYRGKVSVLGVDTTKVGSAALFEKGLGVLPQDPQTLFTRSSIRDDLLDMVSHGRHAPSERGFTASPAEVLPEIAELTEITTLLDQHPYDVSGGEQQRAALAKVLLTNPKLLLMDEPTKGMDSFFKRKLAGILRKLRDGGMTVLIVSHDLEFCAQYADRCALFFDGNIVTENAPRAFFSGNSFYTTAANRMSRHIFEEAITAEDVIERCRQAKQR
ncbi:MAG: ATP-binding cassette domain-containing protein [Clostridiales Family XIII bacterium]|jgi:energy-coupling factor transport system ATP-binding protein|nr:ATP-binding cassette domain-containing protein [Clostridiales Family XIII bacterium]